MILLARIAFALRLRHFPAMPTSDALAGNAHTAPVSRERAVANGFSRRQKMLMAAAVGGGIFGGVFSLEIAAALGSLWSNYIVPAYFELFMSGIPFCG